MQIDTAGCFSRLAQYSWTSALRDQEFVVCNMGAQNTQRRRRGKERSVCLYVEQYLRSSVSSACKCLDGFDASKMEPIDYISSSDVKNKFVDICLGKKVVATINLTTGEITSVNIPEQKSTAKDNSPTAKS